MLAVFAIRYLVNQVVLGVVLNVFAAGLTGFLYDAFMQPHAATLNQAPLLDNIKLPLLGSIPVIGPLLLRHDRDRLPHLHPDHRGRRLAVPDALGAAHAGCR